MNTDQVRKQFSELIPTGIDFCSLRVHQDQEMTLAVQQGVAEPIRRTVDYGAMVVVYANGGYGYGATSNVTKGGLKDAMDCALKWAKQSARHQIFNASNIPRMHPRGEFRSPVKKDLSSYPVADLLDLLKDVSKRMHIDARIVNWDASLWRHRSQRLYLTNEGGEVFQDIDRLTPYLQVTASDDQDIVTRSAGGLAYCKQQGLELLDLLNFNAMAAQIGDEALQLLAAPNCPNGNMDIILDPDQMVLQIHESIGHPLELDRILGDERNYAGTSFVTLDMFGNFQYGSDKLNVTFDPTNGEQAASFAFDDEGRPATREYLIKNGMLLRPIGGALSEHRAHELGYTDIQGVANARADSWRRPPIDRMANINLEAGSSTLDEMIASIENGVLMKTNCSWSIDDSRNKFQFSCEWGQTIKDGKLGSIVKKPSYRGVSSRFWRSLDMVGDPQTLQVLGTPYCGKGEPNQAVFVGHASPPCLFRQVEVFGGV